MPKTINLDFDLKKIMNDIKRYFNNLPQDMLIAWGVLGLGFILIIVGLILM